MSNRNFNWGIDINIFFLGYVVMGSNGEFPYLEKEERLEVVKFAKQVIKDSGKPLIAGSGCECKLKYQLSNINIFI